MGSNPADKHDNIHCLFVVVLFFGLSCWYSLRFISFFKWTLRDFFVPTVWLLIPKLCSAYEKCITFIFFVESCPRPGGWDLITLSSRFVKHSTKVLKCWAGPPCDGQSRCAQNSEDVIEATHPGGVWTPLASVTSSQQEEDHFCNRSATNL